MSVHSTVNAFLGRHGFSAKAYDVNTVIDSLLYDMEKGLDVGPGNLDSMDATEPMICTWGLPPEESPKNKTVIQLFEEQVQRTPNATAVVFEDKKKERNMSHRNLPNHYQRHNYTNPIAVQDEINRIVNNHLYNMQDFYNSNPGFVR